MRAEAEEVNEHPRLVCVCELRGMRSGIQYEAVSNIMIQPHAHGAVKVPREKSEEGE